MSALLCSLFATALSLPSCESRVIIFSLLFVIFSLLFFKILSFSPYGSLLVMSTAWETSPCSRFLGRTHRSASCHVERSRNIFVFARIVRTQQCRVRHCEYRMTSARFSLGGHIGPPLRLGVVVPRYCRGRPVCLPFIVRGVFVRVFAVIQSPSATLLLVPLH